MRKLDRGDSAWLEHDPNAADEIVEIRDLGQHVVADHKICCHAFRHHLPSGLTSKESQQGRHTLLFRHLGDVGGGFHAQHGNPFLHEILQQVSVVAGELHHQALGAQVQALRDHVHVVRRMFEPAVRVGREIGVFRKDVLGADIFL